MTPCQICDSADTENLLSWRAFTIHRCNSCKLVFGNPLPSDAELEAFYQGFMFNTPKDSDIERQTRIRKKELQQLFSFPKEADKRAKKSFLDYGGGTGIVFHTVKQLGLDAFYQDLDQEAIRFTTEKFGLTDAEKIPTIAQTDKKFDYILSDNVIEHVKHPIQFANELVHALNAGGTLVFKTPNARNTQAFFNPMISLDLYFRQALKYNSFSKTLKAFFKRFWHCEPPRHIYSFSKKSLDKLVEGLDEKELSHEVLYYKIPLFTHTLTQTYFSRKITGISSLLKRILQLPIVLVEIVLQLLKQVLVSIGIVSPGGIILKIQKR